MKIKINYEELETLKNQLKNQEEVFCDCVSGMRHIIGKLENAWEGRSANAYTEQFESLQPGFEKTRQIIETLCFQIEETMAQMQEKDEQIAEKLKF